MSNDPIRMEEMAPVLSMLVSSCQDLSPIAVRLLLSDKEKVKKLVKALSIVVHSHVNEPDPLTLARQALATGSDKRKHLTPEAAAGAVIMSGRDELHRGKGGPVGPGTEKDEAYDPSKVDHPLVA